MEPKAPAMHVAFSTINNFNLRIMTKNDFLYIMWYYWGGGGIDRNCSLPIREWHNSFHSQLLLMLLLINTNHQNRLLVSLLVCWCRREGRTYCSSVVRVIEEGTSYVLVWWIDHHSQWRRRSIYVCWSTIIVNGIEINPHYDSAMLVLAPIDRHDAKLQIYLLRHISA